MGPGEHSQTVTMEGAPARGGKAAWVRASAGYVIGAGCLYWVFHDVQWKALVHSLTQVRWAWLPVSVVFSLLTYTCVAWQWQFLLRPLGRVPLPRLLQAVFAGRFANDVLPVHMGYIIRVYLVSRWLKAPLTAIVPSLLIERLCDGLWIATAIGVTALFIPLPASLLHSAEVLGVLLLVGTAALVWIVFGQRKRPATGAAAVAVAEEKRGAKAWHKVTGFFERLRGGVGDIGRSWILFAGLVLGALKVLLQALAFLTVLWAYDFHFPPAVQSAIFLVALIGIALPSTPASAGVFQLFCVAGLVLFGVPKATATGFALLAFVVLTAPLALCGFLAVARSGMTLRELRAGATERQRA